MFRRYGIRGVSLALSSPSPGGGGSTLSVSEASGWGELSISKIHPTPLASLATLPLQGRVKVLLRHRFNLKQRQETKSADQFASAGLSFFTSASDGSTVAPSTYLKSAIVPLPPSSAILPT